MSLTTIYTSRKLEKVSKEFVSKFCMESNTYLGAWSATLFTVSRKKCWLLINKQTKYLLILADVKKSDLKNITTIFKATLYKQLTFDGIVIKFDVLEKMIGEVKLCETDNDRSANGSLNNCLFQMDDWKRMYGNYENMVFRDLNNRLNSSPNKMLNWKYPKEKMGEMIKAYK